MLYIIRDTAGDIALALTFRGALGQLALGTYDAAVYTVAGRWIAGRRVGV